MYQSAIGSSMVSTCTPAVDFNVRLGSKFDISQFTTSPETIASPKLPERAVADSAAGGRDAPLMPVKWNVRKTIYQVIRLRKGLAH